MNRPELPPATLADRILALILTNDLPALGPAARPGTRTATEIHRLIAPVLDHFRTPPAVQDLVRAAVLLWHDRLDEAHRLVQDGDSRESAFIHGIIHRREPDYSNARYWFHRVGRHAAFPALARAVSALGRAPGAGPLPDLVRGGDWQPMALIEACERFADQAGSAEHPYLQRVQELEFRALLEHICGSV